MSPGTPIDTRKVHGRRKLHFETLDDLRSEAEYLARVETTTLGNWSLGQIYQHLAKGLNLSIDGVDIKPPLWMRLLMPLLKSSMIHKPMPAGFRLPQQAARLVSVDDEITTQAGLQQLLNAIARCKATTERAPHPLFGRWTEQEANQFHLRHAELHLSFVLPSSP